MTQQYHLVRRSKGNRIVDSGNEMVRAQQLEQFRQLDAEPARVASTSRVRRGTLRAITAMPPMIMAGAGSADKASATARIAPRIDGFSGPSDVSATFAMHDERARSRGCASRPDHTTKAAYIRAIDRSPHTVWS